MLRPGLGRLLLGLWAMAAQARARCCSSQTSSYAQYSLVKGGNIWTERGGTKFWMMSQAGSLVLVIRNGYGVLGYGEGDLEDTRHWRHWEGNLVFDDGLFVPIDGVVGGGHDQPVSVYTAGTVLWGAG